MGEGKLKASCPACGEARKTLYWCAGCRQASTDKRCPLCGLKLKKMLSCTCSGNG